MGIMPPYDPLRDPQLAWAIGRVLRIVPERPTWSRPGTISFAVDEVLRGELPSAIELPFGPPREAEQAYFYAQREAGAPPWDAATQARVAARRAELDARLVDVPAIGAVIGVWLAHDTAGWHVPTARVFGAMPFPLRSRWVEAPHLEALRRSLAAVR
ncbi:MAG: hypothetical protein K1X94_02810 [Sandaracinaceae bacterium]|nr:hypothetical protein [Sandaracinaceae bacterium]